MILPVKCYIDNVVRLRSCIRNGNFGAIAEEEYNIFYLSIDYTG
jgi:hypothetical protein